MPSWAINSKKLSNYIKLNKMDDNTISVENTQLGIGDIVCTTWLLTPQLRWKLKEVDMMDGTAMNINELQQMWQGSNGEQKWKPVPFVE